MAMDAPPGQADAMDPGPGPLNPQPPRANQAKGVQLTATPPGPGPLGPWPLALAGLVFGVLADLLLFQPGPGLGATLFLLLLPAAFGALLQVYGLRPHVKSLGPLLLAYGFFATMLSVRASLFVTSLNGLACLVLLALLACLALPGQLLDIPLTALVAAPCRLLAASLYRAAPIVEATLTSALAHLRTSDKRSLFWPLVRGLLLSIPVLVVLVPLLAAADSIFADRLQALVRAFNAAQIFETVWRLERSGVVAWLALGGLSFALTARPVARSSGSQEARPLGAIEAITVLSSVALVFGAFLSIQVTDLFGGASRVLSVPGVTFAKYARRGFAELVVVALLTLVLVLGLAAVTRRSGHQALGFSALSTAIVAETLVLLGSAWSRMAAYEAAYGATQTRIQVDVFILWLGAALLWLLLTLWSRRWAPRFAIGALVCGLGYVTSLNLLNPDALVAKRNIERWQATGNLDTSALCNLSDDARELVIPLAGKLKDQDARQRINNWIASHSNPSAAWQSWHWAKRSQQQP